MTILHAYTEPLSLSVAYESAKEKSAKSDSSLPPLIEYVTRGWDRIK